MELPIMHDTMKIPFCPEAYSTDSIAILSKRKRINDSANG
jgi:hypothetical protein